MVLNDTLRRGASQHGEGAFISETLKRSLSSKTQRDVIKQDIEEQDGEIGEEATFEPLDIPAPNAAGMSELQGYRMPRKQYETIQKTLAMFNGTHNWHNYIPNANPNDHRNFMRIVNLDMSPLEVHEGMEWIRFKVQANVFAKYQLRKMIAMLIMVVRTNTPRAVVANSYSVSQIDIPDSPGIGLILDEPHYNSFNAMAIQAGEQPVNFGASNVILI